ncbi:MAG: hypothetical protein F6K32_12910 [Desertifilum sp. SIO1I2]|nr:hypothetical protein [Desertifilum sp. SIO1I2]
MPIQPETEKMQYQVGGSLARDAPSYVDRQADRDLCTALQQGQFCYVFTARQMGKTSLLVRTYYHLRQQGYCCTVLDCTAIGGEQATPLQWYKGMLKDLWRGLPALRTFDLQSWWKQQQDLSFPQRLSQFFSEVLLPTLADRPIVILIDEIESLLNLPFAVDDFFAVLRSCYDRRSLTPDYHRLNFAIFGVTTPHNLVSDRQSTLFTEGSAIALNDFTPTQAQPLAQGLAPFTPHPHLLLAEILKWTNGQPFLTQKLCQMAIAASPDSQITLRAVSAPEMASWLETLVRDRLLYNWQWQDEPQHLKTIRDRLLLASANQKQRLHLYHQVLHSPLQIAATPSNECTELLLSGLVVAEAGYLRVKNPIYAQIFNTAWIESQL